VEEGRKERAIVNGVGKIGLLGALAVATVLVGSELLRAGGAASGAPPPANIQATDVKGEEWSLASFKGKPVIVSFFATWCGPCMMEMPHLEAMQKKHRARGLEVAVITEEGLREIEAIGMQKAPFRVLINGSAAFTAYRVSAIPRLFYFAPDGSIAHELEGFDEGGLREIDAKIGKLPTIAGAAKAGSAAAG
jgi:thiol-disulfide isomerase/thioredoxin